jgi:hypothetical protein
MVTALGLAGRRADARRAGVAFPATPARSESFATTMEVLVVNGLV